LAKQGGMPSWGEVRGGMVPRRHARASWQRAAGVRDQLLTRLIKDDGRPLRIVGLSVEVQDLFHPGDKVRADRRDAPLLMLPRLKVVFLSTWRIVSWESVSANPNSTAWSSSNRNFHRSRPPGAVLHVTATRYASALPLSLRGCPGRGRSWRAPSRSVLKRCRVRSIVAMLVSTASAISSSVSPSSALSKIR